MCVHAHLHMSACQGIKMDHAGGREIREQQSGRLLESPVGMEAFPSSSAGWLNVWELHGDSRGSVWESGPLVQEPCCESPGHPGWTSPQDALHDPSRDRLDLKSEHHSNSPRAGPAAHMCPCVSSSLRPVPCVPSYMHRQPCSLRQRLSSYHLPVA